MRTDFQVRQSHPSFHLDKVNQCVWLGEAPILLSPKAFAVLVYLADRPGTLVTKQELLDAVWPGVFVTEGVLKRAVLEIRKALADAVDEPRYIQTLHRRGYRFLRPLGQEAVPAESRPAQPDLVGRRRELAQLDTWFEQALAGSRQVVFITGEAGLGKTTLTEHWMSGRSDAAVAR